MILVSLASALFWGAAHALWPGHGKTIVAAYLVGQRGTPWHAVLLGLIVTITHTVGVFGLGIVTLLLSQFIVPDHALPVAEPRLRADGGRRSAGRCSWRPARAGAEAHDHDTITHHDHDHPHDHGHGHEHAGSLSARLALAVGVSGGLLPCPSALVVLLAAISLHRVAFGLALIVAFSLGLALSITGIGLVAVSPSACSAA